MAHIHTDIYNKFINGDALSDAELNVGINHFTKLADALVTCGPVFKLAANEAIRVSQRLLDFRNARQRG